ncbi:dihydrodipicolinate synthase family protein [soil metagenome]
MNLSTTKAFQLIAAPFTAFHADGSLNPAIIERQCEALVKDGVTGAFVCGTTGEGASLTVEERMAVAERWCAVRPAGFRVFVHMGHTSLRDAQTLARHAEKSKADAIAAIAPFFFKPAVPELVEFFRQVTAGVSLPFFFYHIPAMSGVNVKVIDFLRAAEKALPALAGIKFTHEDLMDFAACMDFAGGKYEMLFGRDEILLPGLATGARGAVGSTYNYDAPIYLRVVKAFDAGDLSTARREQAVARRAIDVLIRFGGLPAGKAILKLRGVDCGPVRSPLRALSNEQIAELEKALSV